MLTGLAQVEATSTGIARNFGPDGGELLLTVIAPDGTTRKPYRKVFDLVRYFGTEEEWLAALTEACRAGGFSGIERVLDGLARLPLGEMVAPSQRSTPRLTPPMTEASPRCSRGAQTHLRRWSKRRVHRPRRPPGQVPA